MKPAARRRTHGFATVELALILLFLLPVGACLIVLGGLLHHYAGMERAGYAAARYLVSVPRAQVITYTGFQQNRTAARALLNASLEQAGLPLVEAESIEITCEPVICGSAAPKWIKVKLSSVVTGGRWDVLTSFLLGGQGMLVTVNVGLRYEN